MAPYVFPQLFLSGSFITIQGNAANAGNVVLQCTACTASGDDFLFFQNSVNIQHLTVTSTTAGSYTPTTIANTGIVAEFASTYIALTDVNVSNFLLRRVFLLHRNHRRVFWDLDQQFHGCVRNLWRPHPDFGFDFDHRPRFWVHIWCWFGCGPRPD